MGFLASGFRPTCQRGKESRRKVSRYHVHARGAPFYSARIEGDFISAKLVLPKFEGFIIVAQKQSQNYIASGLKTKLVVSLVYELIAPKPGIFTIKEITVKDKNNEFKSRPISIEVTGKPMQDKRKIQPYISNATDI